MNTRDVAHNHFSPVKFNLNALFSIHYLLIVDFEEQFLVVMQETEV